MNNQVSAEPYPWPFDGDWSVKNTALLCIDFQVGYCSSVSADSYLERASKVLAAFRVWGGLVVHLRQVYVPELTWSPVKAALMQVLDSEPKRFMEKGSAACDFIEPMTPIKDEVVMERPAVNGFIASDLNNTLRKSGVRNLVIMGPSLEGAVHATVCAANDRGFENLLLLDCCGVASESTAETVKGVTIMGNGLFGTVSDAASLLSQLNESKIYE